MILALALALMLGEPRILEIEPTNPDGEPQLLISYPSKYPCRRSLTVKKYFGRSYAECTDPSYVDVWTKAGVVRVNRETGEVRGAAK